MPKLNYERPRGLDFGVSRIFNRVARPLLETRRCLLTAKDAEFVCSICSCTAQLTHPGVEHSREKFVALLEAQPEQVGILITAVGAWRSKELTSKTGRARRIIEIAMTQRPNDPELSHGLMQRVAAEAGIDFTDISEAYLRGRLNDIRREVREEDAAARVVSDEEIDAYLATLGIKPTVQKLRRK